MSKTEELLARLEGHEKECLVRYEMIQMQLDQGSKKFDKLDFKKYEEFTMWDLVIKHPNLEKKQIEKLKNRAALYYIKPKYIFKNLLKVFARAIF